MADISDSTTDYLADSTHLAIPRYFFHWAYIISAREVVPTKFQRFRFHRQRTLASFFKSSILIIFLSVTFLPISISLFIMSSTQEGMNDTYKSEIDYADAGMVAGSKATILKYGQPEKKTKTGRDRSDATAKTTNRNPSNSKKGKNKEDKFKLKNVISEDNSEMYGTVGSMDSTWTMGSVWTTGDAGSKFTLASDQSMGIDTVMKGSDVHYVTQRFGFASIIVSIIQLFFLTITLSMCGLAPVNINGTIGPYPDALSNIGAINSYDIVVSHQYWRFLTAPFITSGIFHLLLNVLVLLEAAAFLEKEWGTVKWLTIYTFSSIGSVAFSCALDMNMVNVASSGALMGLLGAKMSEFLMILNFRTKKQMSDEYYTKQIILMLIVTAFVSLFILIPYVSWAGHVGGFFCGFTMGMILLARKIKNDGDRTLWWAAGIGMTGLLCLTIVSMILETNPDELLEDVCNYFADIHTENYNCDCMF